MALLQGQSFKYYGHKRRTNFFISAGRGGALRRPYLLKNSCTLRIEHLLAAGKLDTPSVLPALSRLAIFASMSVTSGKAGGLKECEPLKAVCFVPLAAQSGISDN
jgi:hypothetical protein